PSLTVASANATTCAAPWTTAIAVTGSQSVKPTASSSYVLPPPRSTLFPYTTLFRSINTPVSSLIPQQQMRVVSVDSQDVVGGNYDRTSTRLNYSDTFWHTDFY